ncbi:Gfo/Idh/MocA family protein [Gracilibacillus timonensis]|uniref:Gfo/Idh/MocA family protein n=1 Tax=Gracilibacillus timonensis TaxID=1816696 RepID=UPI000826F387|nr:Gfo/Idh/MocA family oxidoreductase [Gracilibacillus timonensis]
MNIHKVIMVGCGGMANIWLDYADQQETIELAGLVDVKKEAAQQKAEERELQVPIFTDLQVAIETTGATIVFDATIPAAHPHIVSTALQAGCHVFGEKPMAESLTDANQMLELVVKTDRAYNVMQNRRYLQEIRTLRAAVEQGLLGEVHTINSDFYLGPHFGGFREKMEHPLLVDMAIHTFDQARFISGCNATSVYCHAFDPAGSWYDGYASMTCIFEMENGSVYTYRGSWAAEGLRTSWNGDWRIIGTKGTATWDGFDKVEAEVVQEKKDMQFLREMERYSLPNSWQGRESHFGCLDEMFAALDQERSAETSCFDNIESMKMVFAAMESIETGKKVNL